MKQYKYDTHVHTAETSSCGKVAAEDMVKMYKDCGYDGIIITDHYNAGYFGKIAELSWTNQMDRFLHGYRTAKEMGIHIGLDILLGMEIRFPQGDEDYLVYGFDENFLYENKELYKMDLKTFKTFIKEQDMLIYQAHPFRQGMGPARAQYLDGMEVFNGNPRHNSHNELALDYAKDNELLMISGSDAHQLGDEGKGGVILSERLHQSVDFVRYVREHGPVELLGLSVNG